VIRKLTYCPRGELRAHAQKVLTYRKLSRSTDQQPVLITNRIFTNGHLDCLRLFLDIQQHGVRRLVLLDLWHRRCWLMDGGWCCGTAADAANTVPMNLHSLSNYYRCAGYIVWSRHYFLSAHVCLSVHERTDKLLIGSYTTLH